MTGTIKATRHFLFIALPFFPLEKSIGTREQNFVFFRFLLFCSLAIIACNSPTIAETMTLSPQQVFSSIKTYAAKNLEGSITVLKIDKRAHVILKYSRIKTV